jgi:hypothetical protein
VTPLLLLLVPFCAGLLCLVTPSRVWWERLNLGAFAVVAMLAISIGLEVGHHGKVKTMGGAT